MSIQGLRPEDNDRTFPLIAPLIEARWEPDHNVLGGRARLRASAVALERDQAPGSPSGVRIPGLDSRRVTGEADWRATWTTRGGLRASPFAELRVDAYSLDDLPSTAVASSSETRALAVVGVDFGWPLFRPIRNGVVVIEPLAQLALSPESDQIVVGRTAAGEPIYLDEDSQAFEFDESNLFRANKFPGFDLFEDGARLNVAGRASVFWNDGRRASLLVGRSFRDEMNDVFPARTGLRTTSSDWIVAADAQPMAGVSMFARARLDSESLEVRRAEAGANAYTKYGYGYVRYLRDELDLNGSERENLDFGGEIYVTKHWGVTAYANRDLVQDAWIIRDLGVVYRDECTRLELVYRREDTIVGRLGPSESINLRLTLATLGGPIYAD
jgi:LPS-assembly protein